MKRKEYKKLQRKRKHQPLPQDIDSVVQRRLGNKSQQQYKTWRSAFSRLQQEGWNEAQELSAPRRSYFPIKNNCGLVTRRGLRNATPIQCFGLFFTPFIMQHLLSTTINSKKTQVDIQVKKIYKKTISEARVWKWIGVSLQMRVNPKRALPLYWKNDQQNMDPWIKHESGLNRDQFQSLQDHLDFDLNVVVDEIRARCREHWIPYPNVVVDEGICPWRGDHPDVV